MKIQKNDKAPYSGVLLSNELFDSMRVDIYKSDEYKSQLQKSLARQNELLDTKPADTFSTFFTGAALGAAIILFLPLLAR